LRLVLGVTASAAIFWAILRFIGDSRGSRAAAAFEPGWASAAVALSSLQLAIVTLRWTFFARRLAAPLSYRAALGAYYVSTCLNQLLPLGMLGDAWRGFWHARRLGATAAAGTRPALAAATALILDRASGQLVSIALIALVLPLWWQPVRTALAGLRLSFGAHGVLLALLGLSALLLGYFWRSALRRTAHVRRIFFQPRSLAAHGACSALAVFVHVAGFYCAARALGLDLPFGLALRVVLLVLVASSLPSFAFGMGAREAVGAALYHLLGLRAADGAEIALATGLLGFIASSPGLLVLALARWRARSSNGALSHSNGP
jgi:uncharacterized membrane protein YbhN (UPF0104 family)